MDVMLYDPVEAVREAAADGRARRFMASLLSILDMRLWANTVVKKRKVRGGQPAERNAW